MADDNITLVIDLESKDAQAAIELFGSSVKKTFKSSEDAVDKFEKETKKSTNRFSKNTKQDAKEAEGSLKSLGISFGQVAALFTTGLVVVGFKKAVEAAQESDRAIRQLEISLANTGEFSKQASQEFQDYASNLQKTTGISDEAVLSSVALAKSFGLTNKQAKSLTTAAIELSAATGKDLESSIQQLGGTFSGTVGKLSKLGPEFKNLTEQQLKAGAAIDIVNRKFAGTAEALSGDFSGSIQKANNAFGDILENLGKAVTQSPAVIEALSSITDVLNNTADKAANNQGGLQSIIGSIVGFSSKTVGFLVAGLSQGVEGIRFLIQAVAAVPVAFLSVLRDVSSFFTTAVSFYERQINFIKGLIESFIAKIAEFVSFIPGAGGQLQKLGVDVDGLAKKFDKASSESFDKASSSIGTFGDKAQQAIDGVLLPTISDFANASSDLADPLKKFQDGLDEVAAKALVTAENISKIKDSTLDTSKGIKNVKLGADEVITPEVKKEAKSQAAQFASIALNAISQGGRAGATSLFSQAGGALGEAFFPGFGGVISQALTILSNPDSIKGLIKGLVDNIPVIIEAIAASVPLIVDALVESLIVDGGIIRIAVALVKAMINVSLELGYKIALGFLETLAEAAPAIGGRISDGFKEGIAAAGGVLSTALQKAFTFIAEPFKGFKDTFANLVKPLVDGFKSLIAAFQPLNDALNAVKDALDSAGSIGGKGGGKGVISEGLGKIGGALGFATGGVVPGSGNSDSVPALLTPGELVVPNDLVGSLGAFLSGQGGGSDSAILMAILQAVQQPMVVNAEAKVNQSAFANIVLQLNRQNARLTA